MNLINLKKNEIINTRSAGIMWRCKIICYICKEKIEKKSLKDKKYGKVRGHCHYKSNYD